MINLNKLATKIEAFATAAVEEFIRHGGDAASKRANLLTRIFESNAKASGKAAAIARATALIAQIAHIS